MSADEMLSGEPTPRDSGERPPVRLCCMTRHYGPLCPDGKFMCGLCFNRFTLEEASIEDGQRFDVCWPCAYHDGPALVVRWLATFGRDDAS